MIVATVSGPDTYYDYHGQILGYQYLLATHFAQHIGARLRVELCRDTLELMQTLERGDVDIVAYPLTFTDIGKADLVSCGQSMRPTALRGPFVMILPCWPKP